MFIFSVEVFLLHYDWLHILCPMLKKLDSQIYIMFCKIFNITLKKKDDCKILTSSFVFVYLFLALSVFAYFIFREERKSHFAQFLSMNAVRIFCLIIQKIFLSHIKSFCHLFKIFTWSYNILWWQNISRFFRNIILSLDWILNVKLY